MKINTNNFKTTWNFLDCTHDDVMYLSWNRYNNTGSFIGGHNLTLEEKLHWHTLEIENLKSQLNAARGVNTQLGIKWANKNAQSMKSAEVKTLAAKKKKHIEAMKTIKSILDEYKNIKKENIKNGITREELKMTSQELRSKAKEVKKIEDTIKTLEATRKQLMELHKLNYDAYKVITEKFNDDLYYDIEDKINELKQKLSTY